MSMADDSDDGLAYGEFHEREVPGDTTTAWTTSTWARQGMHDDNIKPTTEKRQSTMSFLFDKVHKAVHEIGNDIKDKISGQDEYHGHTHQSGQCSDGAHDHDLHRFQSFAPQRIGNDAKWYVDAAGYMHAVSVAIERARESIWILDWWLSPELYLRRPPARNEQYRIDRMLQAAAERGVQINIIVYKEVTQALTRKYLNPTLPDYIHSLLPASTDPISSAVTRLGLDATFKSLEYVEREYPLMNPPIAVSSAHTKHHLEKLHPGIRVFRHPDHLPDRQVLTSSFLSSIQNMKLTAANASKLPGDALKALYGVGEDSILYWAHHEKLCLIDNHIAFMGGIDLCYGRWDTNQHSIADSPTNLDNIVFPGQDYNNARILDFSDVAHWQNNKLNRKYNARMGWSDLSISLTGPVVEDLKQHFAQRWNFIFREKYNTRNDDRYALLDVPQTDYGVIEHGFQSNPDGAPPQHIRDRMMERWQESRDYLERSRENARHHFPGGHQHPAAPPGIPCQIMRSCAKWSHGVPLEHSICNAYMDVIKNSRHFVYIENQFFITATGDKQRPVKNKIGAAIVERIVRAAREQTPYKVIVVMPAIPAFAGDLKNDDALSTRAILEFQYNSINRGGHSIMEEIARQGIDPTQYIRFYNLRNYDRINSSSTMQEAEQQSGVNYDDARQGYDQYYSGGDGAQDQHTQGGAYGGSQGRYDNSKSECNDVQGQYNNNPQDQYNNNYQNQYNNPQEQYNNYQRYQEASSRVGAHQGLGSGRWDSVAECYMLNGEDIRNIPWEDGATEEIDAFVSELLYVHSKLLIADDRVVICGSANLNDRSQVGDHDSEIAICIEDPQEVDSMMAGRPWRATKFAASLRRQLFRKHLGLLPPQDVTRPDQNFEPVGSANLYDWGSREDEAVIDPVSSDFLNLWNGTARTNTEAFERVFHPVPTDKVRNWKQYDDYFERFFAASEDAKEKKGKDPEKPSQWKIGHVVAEEFPSGVQEVKEVLSQIRGTLVEMPLLFLKDEDIAKESLGLNAFTEEVYT